MRYSVAKSRALAAGTMICGFGMSAAMAFPGDKPQEKGGDLAAILEKLPPEVRETLITEIDRIRAEAEKMKVEALERAEQLKADATKRLEEVKRDARERLERAEGELRRQVESAESAAQVQLLKARAQAELAGQKARETEEKARAQAEKHHAEHAGDHHGAKDHAARKSVTEERRVIVRMVPDGEGKNAEVREMRVEVTKEDGQDKPVVKIFKDGKELKAGEIPGGLVIEDFPKLDVLREAANLEKLPPDQRAEIEKARDELKQAQEKLRMATEKLMKLEVGNRGNVMIFRGKPGEQLNIRPFPGDRVPGVPLPPGAVGRADRLPRPPIMPVPPRPPVAPDLEKRISKAEQALDDILLELKKIQKQQNDDDDDDDDDDDNGKAGRKPRRR